MSVDIEHSENDGDIACLVHTAPDGANHVADEKSEAEIEAGEAGDIAEVEQEVDEDDLADVDADDLFTDDEEVFDMKADYAAIDAKIQEIQATQQASQPATSTSPASDNSLRATVAALYKH